MKYHKKSGFTLMEILIAVAILAIGVVGVVNMFPVGLQAARRTANFSDVAALAQQQMELYRAEYGYESLYTDWFSPGSEVAYPAPDGKLAFEPPYEDYSWWMVLEKNVNLALIEMTLKIYWLDRGREQFETFVTFIADYE